jgi:UDP-GlcNAc:undecaprenyl-phosphate/decaprenyl-phosphate GlcNAc-1-phosphate transferase
MFLIIFLFLYLLEVLYVKIAHYYKIFDAPNNRNSHYEYTVIGGGVVFWVALLIYFLTSDFPYYYFVIGLTIVSLISFWDDIAGLSISYRLFIHFFATSLLLVELSYFSNPLWLIIGIIIFIVGIINAFNFMDGINGMTVGNSIVVVGSLWFINNYHLKFIDNDFLVYILLGLIVFFFFNFRNKAICFAGDIGSISIGFIISFLLMRLIIQENNPVYILFLGVYGVDSVLTIIHRLFLKENIFEPHNLHLFQIIVRKLKIKQVDVSLLYMMIQLIVCIIVTINLKQTIEFQLKIAILIVIVLSILYITIKMRLSKLQNIDLLNYPQKEFQKIH